MFRINFVPISIAITIVLFACDSSSPDKHSTSNSTAQSEKSETIAGLPSEESRGTNGVDYSSKQRTCSQRNPLRNTYFGDLHVHTALSLDAYQQDVRTLPKDAYDFARGNEIPFHGTVAKIDRPLDFAAVTDHAEFLGDLVRCSSNEDPIFDTEACELVRRGDGAAFIFLEDAFEAQQSGTREERVIHALNELFDNERPKVNVEVCGNNGELCVNAKQTGWQQIIRAAENAYDRSSECEFTSFIGYEYSGIKTGSNYHRNIIFRNNKVPANPVSYLDAPLDHELWQQLNEHCNDSVPGCEYLSIPHNSNLSNGKLLTPDYSTAQSEKEEYALAAMRQKAEPLMEIFQHKGQSECINGNSGIDAEYDELCNIEQVRKIGGITRILDTDLHTKECGESSDNGGMIDVGCISRNDYLRGALLTGMKEQRRIGVNPLKLGIIASTDTHESMPGAVDEQSWPGHVGREKELSLRLQEKTGLPYRLDGNPGGLVGVWAEQNTRDSLFDAMKRRETFGTSGPRIQPRFFAGWSHAKNICDSTDFVKLADKEGFPMGADLIKPPHADAKPRFVAAAVRDPQGNLLQRLQIIKGWIDVNGEEHVKVIDVAGDLDKSATVELKTGEPGGAGSNSLCTLYVDETFRHEESSYYYMRVIENPSLRWSWSQCIALPEKERPEGCSNDHPKTIQEMAWTSPIWYSPTTE